MNCALCKDKLEHLLVSCFDANRGGMFNLCFKCLESYLKRYPNKTKNEIAEIISLELWGEINV